MTRVIERATLIRSRTDEMCDCVHWNRAFAVAMPAGTLNFVIPSFLVLSAHSEALDESIQHGAWVVHLAIGEYLTRCRRS